MKSVTIVGSGNAFNIDGRGHACYLLENSAGERMLMDFGATSLLRLNAMKIDADSVDYVTLTHFHGDHMLGLPFLFIHLGLVLRRKRPLILMGPAGVRAAVERVMEIAYPGIDVGFEIDYQEIKTEEHRVGQFVLTPFPISHRPESTGYRVRGPANKTFAFSGDTAFDEKLFALVDGVDAAVIELSMERQTNPPTHHVTLEEVRAGREKLRPRRLIFSHIYDDLAAKAREFGEAAHDGMLIEF